VFRLKGTLDRERHVLQDDSLKYFGKLVGEEEVGEEETRGTFLISESGGTQGQRGGEYRGPLFGNLGLHRNSVLDRQRWHLDRLKKIVFDKSAGGGTL